MKQLARIKYSLVQFVATFKCLDGFSSRVAQALPQRHVDCADYIGLGGLAGAIDKLVLPETFLHSPVECTVDCNLLYQMYWGKDRGNISQKLKFICLNVPLKKKQYS